MVKLNNRFLLQVVCSIGWACTQMSCSQQLLDEIAPTEESELASKEMIQVGGVETSPLTFSVLDEAAGQTRAAVEPEHKNAEDVEWLLDPLFNGIDIRIYPDNNKDDKRIAILKLEKQNSAGGNTKANIKRSETGLAVYSLNYRERQSFSGPAQWQGNGRHHFEGVHVPTAIRYNPQNGKSLDDITKPDGTAPYLTTDQSKAGDNGNYTLLEHYLSMPANWYHNATVERIKLPFKHRLARVIAYVLIDPKLTGVNIKGYKKDASGNSTPTEDATTTALRFCNVNVLNGVKEVNQQDGHERLFPQWFEARKVIPHFVDERASGSKDEDHFIMFYHKAEKEYLFPPMGSKWDAAYDAWMTKYNSSSGSTEAEKIKYADDNSGYERTLYRGKVPVYDIIARPTYATANDVMYDEEEQTSSKTNKINFEIELENGLQYHKEFQFDLNANQQTIVYLRINAESVDYSSSGAEEWISEASDDGYYGVNNQNGNTLSFAGNSWQRAYRNVSRSWGVTDGHFYQQDTEDKYAQYVDDNTWIEMLAQACPGGKHHGDYFILDKDITIDARSLPDNFVFTGHLDGQGHTITLENTETAWTEYIETTDYSSYNPYYTKTGSVYSPVSLPTLYEKSQEPVYYSETECLELNRPHYIPYEESPATYYTSAEAKEENDKHLVADSSGREPGAPEYETTYPQDYTSKQEGDIKTPAIIKHPQDDGYVPHYPDDYIPYTTDRIKEYRDVYTEIALFLADVVAAPGQYYTRNGGAEPYTYTPYTQTTPLYYAVAHVSGSSLFKALNGIYRVAQESNPSGTWEANVHKEKDMWVPVKGYRAELLNLIVNGKIFPTTGTIFTQGDLSKDGATVSGYIFNCKEITTEGTTSITNIVPIPNYN